MGQVPPFAGGRLNQRQFNAQLKLQAALPFERAGAAGAAAAGGAAKGSGAPTASGSSEPPKKECSIV